jgi:hypothetical protein
MQTLKVIDQTLLPRFLAGHNGVILRRDVDQLTASEQQLCEQQIGAALCAA